MQGQTKPWYLANINNKLSVTHRVIVEQVQIMGFGSKGRGWGGCGRGGSGRGQGHGSQNNKNNNQDKKKMEFQPFHEGKGKMTYKQVKQHV